MRHDPRPDGEHPLGRPDHHMAGLVHPGIPVDARHLHGVPRLSAGQVRADESHYTPRVLKGLGVGVHNPCRDGGGPSRRLRPAGGQQTWLCRSRSRICGRHGDIPVPGAVSGQVADLTAGVTCPPLPIVWCDPHRPWGRGLWWGYGSPSASWPLSGPCRRPWNGGQPLGYLPILQLSDQVIDCVRR